MKERSRLIAYRTLIENLLWFCLFSNAYYLAYRYAMTFSHAIASPFWFPDSVLLCALLRSHPRKWWIFVIAILPIRLFISLPQNLPFWFLLATFAIDSSKGVLAALTLRHFNKNPIRFGTVQEYLLFFLVAVLMIPAASAFAGATVRNMIGHDYWRSWGQWFLGNATTQLVTTPAIFYFVFGNPWRIRLPSVKRIIEAGLLAIGLVLSSYLALHSESFSPGFAEPLFFAPVPFLFWAAIRFGMFGASAAIVTIAIIAVHAAIDSSGPFSGKSPAETAMALQNFLIIRAAPLYLVAILVEQRTDVEQSLRESEGRFRNVANAAPVAIWMTAPNKLCIFVNQIYLNFTGRSVEQELGNGWTECIHPDDLQHCLDVYGSSFDLRSEFELEYRARRKDGEYRWFLANGVPRNAPNGEFLGYICTAIDISDRKRVEEAYRHLAHAQRLTMLGEFTAMIAHEVNQPLAAIMSNTEAIMNLLEIEQPPMKEIREILADIRQDDVRANETIRRIRSLLRKREMNMEPPDLNQIASDVLRIIKADATRRHIQIRRDFEQGLPLAFGDPAYLQQVLLNLISNGIDAMKDTSESTRQLIVQTKHDHNNTIEVSVTDCGCGIPSEKLPQIFDSFFTTKDEGMGLGLSIARSIIEAHKGRIWAENNSKGGATFHFAVRMLDGSKNLKQLDL